MNNELRWREFPTDMRGTIFRRFWDRKRAPDDPAGDDIPEIHGWTEPLGANYPPHDVDRTEALVLLIRGDLIRKYGMILAVLNRANSTSFVRGRASITPDLRRTAGSRRLLLRLRRRPRRRPRR